MWTGCHSWSYTAVTAHTISTEWEMKAIVLQLEKLQMPTQLKPLVKNYQMLLLNGNWMVKSLELPLTMPKVLKMQLTI